MVRADPIQDSRQKIRNHSFQIGLRIPITSSKKKKLNKLQELFYLKNYFIKNVHLLRTEVYDAQAEGGSMTIVRYIIPGEAAKVRF